MNGIYLMTIDLAALIADYQLNDGSGTSLLNAQKSAGALPSAFLCNFFYQNSLLIIFSTSKSSNLDFSTHIIKYNHQLIFHNLGSWIKI